jgi:hypothetical protein
VVSMLASGTQDRGFAPGRSEKILTLMGTWRHLAARVETSKGRGSNGKLPLRTRLECSVPEPYRLSDWALVPAKTG